MRALDSSTPAKMATCVNKRAAVSSHPIKFLLIGIPLLALCSNTHTMKNVLRCERMRLLSFALYGPTVNERTGSFLKEAFFAAVSHCVKSQLITWLINTIWIHLKWQCRWGRCRKASSASMFQWLVFSNNESLSNSFDSLELHSTHLITSCAFCQNNYL